MKPISSLATQKQATGNGEPQGSEQSDRTLHPADPTGLSTRPGLGAPPEFLPGTWRGVVQSPCGNTSWPRPAGQEQQCSLPLPNSRKGLGILRSSGLLLFLETAPEARGEPPPEAGAAYLMELPRLKLSGGAKLASYSSPAPPSVFSRRCRCRRP